MSVEVVKGLKEKCRNIPALDELLNHIIEHALKARREMNQVIRKKIPGHPNAARMVSAAIEEHFYRRLSKFLDECKKYEIFTKELADLTVDDFCNASSR